MFLARTEEADSVGPGSPKLTMFEMMLATCNTIAPEKPAVLSTGGWSSSEFAHL
jgi:hypothetical protein